MDSVDRSSEPMDIDISLNTTAEIKSFNDDTNKVSPNCISEEIEHRTTCSANDNYETMTLSSATKLYVNFNSKKEYNRGKTIVICSIFAVFISSIIYYSFNVECLDKLDITNLKQILSEKLYGQDIAISEIERALITETPHKIMFFYGSTGVGKSYAVSVMMDNFWNYSNIYHYTMQSFKMAYPASLMTGLIMCPWSIVIIDDLNLGDGGVQYIKEILDKSRKLKNKVTIILIFNCDLYEQGFGTKCDDMFQVKLKTEFVYIDVPKYYVKFNELTNENLIKCIDYELKQSNYVGSLRMSDFVPNFDVLLDGCKSVHKKIQSFIVS